VRNTFSCGHLWKDAERENLFDDAQGLDVGFDSKVSHLVKWQALLIQPAKACFVAKKRTIGDVRATREELFDGAMQPD